MCRMYTVIDIYFENIKYYITEFKMVEQIQYSNNAGVTS